jgi:hypothetical protein
MYKMTKAIALAAVFGLLLFGGYAYATETLRTYAQVPYTASYLLGHTLYGAGNRDLGQITDFIVDRANGRIAMVVLSDVPGFGAEKVAIPFGFIARDPGGALKIKFPEEAPVASLGTGTGTEEFPYEYRDAMAPGVLHGAIDEVWTENLYRHYGYAPYWTESSGIDLYTCGPLMSADLRIQDSEAMAHVDDFVIEPDGHISYVVLSDVPGRDETLVAVPFSLIKSESADVCYFDISQDKLASAPSYDPSINLGDRVYVERVYRFYGVQPYWTIEEEWSTY